MLNENGWRKKPEQRTRDRHGWLDRDDKEIQMEQKTVDKIHEHTKVFLSYMQQATKFIPYIMQTLLKLTFPWSFAAFSTCVGVEP